jgi:hypothetical protein
VAQRCYVLEPTESKGYKGLWQPAPGGQEKVRSAGLSPKTVDKKKTYLQDSASPPGVALGIRDVDLSPPYGAVPPGKKETVKPKGGTPFLKGVKRP